MKRKPDADPKLVRCAIYTRKSSEEGLDQAFNSLHAQREACEAYVESQVGEGWRALPAIYDDGGYSGGTLERPALARLLADIDAGRVDIVVVYKVDRLTRSLTDFSRIVDRLDAAGASFVSITQAFNTTTSMGRLTLNVLLSFAQFEREVTGERIRDKIAASKARGLWMGGNLPLGYDSSAEAGARELVVNPAEASIVRRIFALYLELGSVHALEHRLVVEGVGSKRRVTKSGRDIGGVRLSRGALFHMLKNRVYLGEIPHKDKSYPGRHPAIVGAEVFEAVQTLLTDHRREWRERPQRSAPMPLRGLLFDAEGHPMSPTFTYGRNGKVYRYYVSSPLQLGRGEGSRRDILRRVSAPEVEALIHRQLRIALNSIEGAELPELLSGVQRIDVDEASIDISWPVASAPRSIPPADSRRNASLAVLSLPVRCRSRGGRTWIVAPAARAGSRPARRDPILIRGLQQAHRLASSMGWRSANGAVKGASVKAPQNAYERKLCRLAFLAPDIQRLIVQGHQPPGLNLETLVQGEIPSCWAEQRRTYGVTLE